MKKQIVIMLLMALAAVMLMTVACGSSDDPTDSPGTTRPGTDTSEPASNSQNQDQDEQGDTPPDTKETNRPQVVNTPQVQGSNTTPWPTSAPTRVNTNATVSNPDRTSTPQPTERTQDSAEHNPTRPPGQEPPPRPYDGTSPLIHVFFDQPWIIIPSIEGQTYKPALKGLTRKR